MPANHGGARPGAGRPRAEGERFDIRFRVRGEALDALDEARREGETRHQCARRLALERLGLE